MTNIFTKKNTIAAKINISFFILISILLIFFDIFYKEKLFKSKLFLERIFSHKQFSLQNISKKIKNLHLSRRLFFDNIALSYELMRQNEELQLKLIEAKNKINQITSIYSSTQNIKDQFQTTLCEIIFENKNEFIAKLYNKDKIINQISQNQIIFSSQGLMGKIQKIQKIDNYLIIFGMKMENQNFEIPVSIGDFGKNIGLFLAKNNKIINLNSFDSIEKDDKIFLMPQYNKIPAGIEIGKVEKININESINIHQNNQNNTNIKNEIGLIIFPALKD